MADKKVEVFKGYRQMEAIIQEIMEEQKKGCGGRGYPQWDFINGVLSCKEILGESSLWFHWGNLLIHRPEDEGKNAGAHEELQDWNSEFDDKGKLTIVLIGQKQKSDEKLPGSK